MALPISESDGVKIIYQNFIKSDAKPTRKSGWMHRPCPNNENAHCDTLRLTYEGLIADGSKFYWGNDRKKKDFNTDCRITNIYFGWTSSFF